MQVFYARLDGKLKVENVNPRYRWVEEPDGNHVIAKEAVYQDIEGRAPPVMFIWQDVTEPERGPDSKVSAGPWIVEAEFIKKHHMKKLIGTSRMSIRALVSMCIWLAQAMYFCLFSSLIVFAGSLVLALAGVYP